MSDRLALSEQRPADGEANAGGKASRAMEVPFIAVKHLLPTKARILMMLALTMTDDPSEIQKIFDTL